MGRGDGQKSRRRVEFHQLPAAHHCHPIRIHYRLQTVGDCQNGRRAERRPDRLLNEPIRLGVDARRRFVDADHLGVEKKGSRQAEELLLAGGKDSAALQHVGRKALGPLGDHVAQVATLQRNPQLAVRVPFGRVEVVSNRPTEEERILRNDGQSGSEIPSRKKNFKNSPLDQTSSGFRFTSVREAR